MSKMSDVDAQRRIDDGLIPQDQADQFNREISRRTKARALASRGLKPGKLARYTGEFCRNTGNLFPPVNGLILSVDDRAARSELWIARVVWCDNTGEAWSVRLGNLELDPTVKNETFPGLLREFAEKGLR